MKTQWEEAVGIFKADLERQLQNGLRRALDLCFFEGLPCLDQVLAFDQLDVTFLPTPRMAQAPLILAKTETLVSQVL
jgi:hypothetical protein